ncbi:MAG: phage holin family protein [Verrucomicrobia bacterium]|nr:MAG: phage holin family protein [Verrucomicrobiota bacterium]
MYSETQFHGEWRWQPFLKRWAVTTLGVLVAANVVPGIEYHSLGALLAASLLLGLLNAFVRPFLLLLSLPLLVFTLGLFVLFINACLLYLVGGLVGSGFEVRTFGAAFWGGLLISLVSLAVNLLTGGSRVRFRWRREHRRRFPPEDEPPGLGGSGPLIDV